MIIEALMNLVKGLLTLLLTPINIPGLPEGADDALDTFFGYLDNAAGLIGFVLPIDITIFIDIFLVIFAVEHLVPVVMWILRKIPMLGIS